MKNLVVKAKTLNRNCIFDIITSNKVIFLSLVVQLGCTTLLLAQQNNPIIIVKKELKLTNNVLSMVEPEHVDKFYFFGLGNTDLNFDGINAAGGLSLGFQPVKRLTVFANFNLGSSIKTESSDSVKISSLYFPDVASQTFSGSFDLALTGFSKSSNNTEQSTASLKEKLDRYKTDATHQLLLNMEGSFQRRNIEKDTNVFKLNLSNFNAGIKYRWTYKGINEENKAIVTIGAFYNGVFISRDTERNFSSLFTDSIPATAAPLNIDRSINGWSALFSVQINNAIVYFRTFDDLYRKDELAFTVGLKATAKFFSF